MRFLPPCFLDFAKMLCDVIVNVLAPILVKLLYIEPFSTSIIVTMPINAVIPIAIMATVKFARKRLLLIAFLANDIISFVFNLLQI